MLDLLQVYLLVIKTREGKHKKRKKEEGRIKIFFLSFFLFFFLSFLVFPSLVFMTKRPDTLVASPAPFQANDAETGRGAFPGGGGICEGEGEGEVAFFSAKRWDRRNRVDLIESATPCHDAQVVGPYRDSNPLHLTVLAAMSEDYTTAPFVKIKKILGSL